MMRTRFALLLLPLLLGGCATIVDSASQRFANALSAGILSQTDEQVVRDGLPAYLLLVDGFIAEDPDNLRLLLAGADLYGSYAGAFVDDPERAKRLAGRGRDYGERALCVADDALCTAFGGPFDQWDAALALVDADALEPLYGFAAAWATWIQVNSGDWDAIAELPKVEAAMARVVAIDDGFRDGWPHLYLGVLKTQLPPAYGGKPEEGRQHFQQAIDQSQGRNLMARVLFAERYARLVFDQELHDRLLNETLASDVEADGLTLTNVLAHTRARELLEESNDYF
ncbi:MAG: TRAP transporter TatT component family protein [Pseudomonadota bacterium]